MYTKPLLYIIIFLQIVLLGFTIMLFNNDTQGISSFTYVDPETGVEKTIEGCEELHGLEIFIRNCIDWK